ncbi:MAG: secretin N-terminal domain-containing protein [bacterium]
MANLPKELISIDYDSADIRDVLNMLAAKIGINIIYTDVTGTISLRLNKVPFDEAFKTILNIKGLSTEQVGNNILRVAPPQILIAERSQALQVTQIFPLNYVKAEEIKAQIDSVTAAEGRKAFCTVDTSNNALLITETPSGLESVARLIKHLDQKPKQVLIEAKLVEVSLTKALDIGIDWSASGSASGVNTFSGDTSNLKATNIYGTFRFGRIGKNYNISKFDFTIAEKNGRAKVLSDPKVATLNNKEANINITTQIPYLTTETSASTPPTITQKVVYVTVGIMLKVTPTVNADGRVSLKINPTVSQPSVKYEAVAGGAPGIDTRSADTTVMIRDGETIVIGGLIYDTVTENTYKIPILGDIPLLGWFFKKKAITRDRSELLIFVTPRILEG